MFRQTKYISLLALSCMWFNSSTFGSDTPDILSDGLDSTDIVWENETANGWFTQNDVTFDGEDAITSYGPGDYSTSMVSSLIEGPGVMRFYWKVSSEERYDFLIMSVDGQRRLAISGEKDWEEVEYYLEEGTHVVSFAYQRDESVSEGDDRGWVDQFSFNFGEEIAPPDISDAFGVEGLNWVTSQFRPWRVSDEIDDSTGSLIAESATLGQSGISSWVETKISGPALVSFDYKLSNFNTYGFEFEILVDEEVNDSLTWRLSGSWENFDVFIPSGVHSLRLQLSTTINFFSGSASLLLSNMSVQKIDIPVVDENITLAESLDSNGLVWRTSGLGNWYPQSEITYDDEDAAVSGIAGLTGWQTYSALTTTVRGPGILDYSWYYKSDNSGVYKMYVNGYEAGGQTLEETWTRRSYILPEGDYEIEFVHVDYSLEGIVTSYAILDQVNFRPGEQFELTEGQSPVADAINTDDFKWVTGGDGIWYSEVATEGSGLVARADVSNESGNPWVLTEVSGPGMLDFEWGMQKTDDIIGFLVLLIDGEFHSMIDENTDWDQMNVYIEEGVHEISFRYENGPWQTNSEGSASVWLRNIGFRFGETPDPPPGSLALAEALDTEQLEWVSAGDAAWFGQEIVSFDNEDSASSGSVRDGKASWMETEVEGPGKISFIWRVSSEVNYDYLILEIDGQFFDGISGLKGWTSREIYLPDGIHKIRFTYSKDFGGAAGSDRGWVDRFQFEQGIGPAPDPSGITLTDALDLDGLVWNTGGDGNWVASTNANASNDGVDVAEGGPVNSSMNYKWMATFVEGPANLSFYWRYNYLADSGFDYNFDSYLEAYLGDTLIAYCESRTWERVEAFIPPGFHLLRFDYGRLDYAQGSGLGAWVDQVQIEDYEQRVGSVTIEEAFDVPGREFSSVSDYDIAPRFGDWIGIESGTRDLVVSPYGIDSYSSNLLETIVTGPADISFIWKASTELDYDFGRFLVNGSIVESISGITDWQEVTVQLPAGDNILGWEYQKDGSVSEGDDVVYLDQLEINELFHQVPKFYITLNENSVNLFANGVENVNYELWGSRTILGTYELLKSNINAHEISTGYEMEIDGDAMFFKLTIQE